MKLIVFSDTHGSELACEAIYRAETDADVFFHLGDGYAQAEALRMDHPLLALVCVRGNCDFTADDADAKTATFCGKKILFTHGHRFGVKSGMAGLHSEAVRQGADIVLFGHTHVPFHESWNGIEFYNPGSAVTSAGVRYLRLLLSEDGSVDARPILLPV